ncbi:MAG: ABC transporter permease [Saprospiraceae bacterium]|nr:ABC transporter permease [Saprospiraceae bacterium]MBL0294831.1 ABC transporter permease [Saprospiraceae bacterium]
MNTLENLKMALRSVRSNVLRASLTLMIIAFGIMALVGILTAIDSILYSMSDNFSSMGANSFAIERKGTDLLSNNRGRRRKMGPIISFRDAMELKEKYKYAGNVFVSFDANFQSVVKFRDEKTNPNVFITGVDEVYLDANGYDIEVGRAFSLSEIQSGDSKILLGADIVKKIFKGNSEYAIDKIVSVDNQHYKVIGVLKSKGSSMNRSSDRGCFMPLLRAKAQYGGAEDSYSLGVAVHMSTEMEDAINYTTGLFRNVRGLRAGEENDFEIAKSDGILKILKDNTVMLRSATIGIGLITLIGAAIGLMNIMLVSVTERTREIGITKALGATRRNILIQFLTEAIFICILGGIVGIFLGILVGNIVTIFIGGSFIIPWAWMTLGMVMCILVGLVSGLYPALKASKLDPIESLRYE